ncbi:adhesion G-protein coupled receptor G7 [Dendrobates tinctorius]|uniref:adhesion G-protein coupled receptor G7 n=1 Tax=Dendrobates tinctorius TaxID=92724 RepID=UPI003CC98B2C
MCTLCLFSAMQCVYRCLYTLYKILICAVIAAGLSLLTWYLIRDFYNAPNPPTPPPPCVLMCQNGGSCENNRCRCPDNYTGELCTIENFCRGSQVCQGGICFTFGDILVDMYGYSKETCNATDVNANTPRATIQCKSHGGSLGYENFTTQYCNENLETLANKTDISPDNAEKVAATTQVLTSDPENLKSDDISNAMKIVNRILNDSSIASEKHKAVVSAVSTVSQILSAQPDKFSNEIVEKEAESLTRTLEALSVNSTGPVLSVVQPSIAIETRQLSTMNLSGISFMSLRGLTDDLVSSRIIVDNDTSNFVLNETAEVQIFVKPVGKTNDNDTVGFVLYQNDNLFPSKHKKTLGFRKKIISASISGASVNIQFSFNQQVDTSSYILLQYACVFWDYKWSEWNTTGCQKKISNQSTSNETSSNSIKSLQCTCNHTTNFAVLMKFKENINFASLNIVSLVGCALSVIGLSITVIFLLYERTKKPTSWLLISFCSSFLIFYIIFIIAMETSKYTIVTENPNQNDSENSFFWSDVEKVHDGACTGLAALQHYFLLAAFVLMALLALELYFRIVHASLHLPEYFKKSAFIIGWGLPAIIVAVTIAATYPEENNYNRKEFCWLLAENKENKFDISKPMLWSFLLPVGLILILNIYIVVAVVFTISRKNAELTRTKKLSFLKKTLATFSVSSLLGVTWVVGYLMLIETDDNTHLIFSFIFCICCSTQGVQVFVFYTLRSPIFLKKVVVIIRKFNSCKVYMHSEKYWVNKLRQRTTRIHREKFRNLTDSTADLFPNNLESGE